MSAPEKIAFHAFEEFAEAESEGDPSRLRGFVDDDRQVVGIAEDLENETSFEQNNSWALNVLAICGGLLIFASLLYVALDIVIWV